MEATELPVAEDSRAMKAARRGAKFLDRKLGRSWRKKIRRSELNMASGSYEVGSCGCIIAQLYGEYEEGIDALNIYGKFRNRKPADEWYGFDQDSETGYGALTQAWKQVLRERAS